MREDHPFAVIDHHKGNTGLGDVNWIEQQSFLHGRQPVCILFLLPIQDCFVTRRLLVICIAWLHVWSSVELSLRLMKISTIITTQTFVASAAGTGDFANICR